MLLSLSFLSRVYFWIDWLADLISSSILMGSFKWTSTHQLLNIINSLESTLTRLLRKSLLLKNLCFNCFGTSFFLPFLTKVISKEITFSSMVSRCYISRDSSVWFMGNLICLCSIWKCWSHVNTSVPKFFPSRDSAKCKLLPLYFKF